MENESRFSKNIATRLGFYVYALVDPRDNTIFYVGSAKGNHRPFAHFRFKYDAPKDAKQERIAEIRRSANKYPRVEIVRYGLETKEICLDVEAAIIDTIGLENLTNNVRGHGVERGRQTAEEINRLLGSPSVPIESISEPVMLFFIDETYSPTKEEIELYDATRQFWHQVSKDARTPLADGRPKYRTAFAVCDGVVVRVYSIEQWFKAGTTQSTRRFRGNGPDRWEFVGRSVEDHPLRGKKLSEKGETLIGSEKGYRYIPSKLGFNAS